MVLSNQTLYPGLLSISKYCRGVGLEGSGGRLYGGAFTSERYTWRLSGRNNVTSESIWVHQFMEKI